MKHQKDHEAGPQKKDCKVILNMKKPKLSDGKNLKIHRLIGVLLVMCMLRKRQQIYFTSNFWFHNFKKTMPINLSVV